MSSNRPVTALATRAADGDRLAWDELVERYAPLVWSICRRYGLDGADARGVGQAVWLEVTDHLSELGEPAALAGRLAAATRRECSRARGIPGLQPPTAEQDERELLAAERDAALREALTRLPRSCQQLIALLAGEKPPSYAQISAQLGIPAASIGPRCRRCLDKLRRDPSIAALLGRAPAAMKTELQTGSLRTSIRRSGGWSRQRRRAVCWFVLALTATSPLTALSPLVAPPRSPALAPPRHLVRGILREDDLQACRREPERAQETDGPPRSTRCPETGLAAENGHARRESPAGQDLPRVS